jgi:hypothetical protein
MRSRRVKKEKRREEKRREEKRREEKRREETRTTAFERDRETDQRKPSCLDRKY